MKKTFFIGLLLVIVLISGLSMASAAAADYLVGSKFMERNGEHYWGPWGTAYSLVGGSLVFDNGIAGGWVTLNIKDEFPVTTYQYALLSIKSDNPADAQDVVLTIGNVKKSFTDWGITLTKDYTVFAVDLVKNGLTTWPNGKGDLPDFALNVVPDKKFTIRINKIKLTNTLPTAE
jgi:hypothetical protein